MCPQSFKRLFIRSCLFCTWLGHTYDGRTPLPVGVGLWLFPCPKSPKTILLCFTHTPRSQPCGNLTLDSCFSWGAKKIRLSINCATKGVFRGKALPAALSWADILMSSSCGDGIGLSPKIQSSHLFQKVSSKDTVCYLKDQYFNVYGLLKGFFQSAVATKFLNLIHPKICFGAKPIISMPCVGAGDNLMCHEGGFLMHLSSRIWFAVYFLWTERWGLNLVVPQEKKIQRV